MEKKLKNLNNLLGLVGRDISYSFSRNYFTEKFRKLQLNNYSYVNFDIPSIADFPSIVKNNPNLRGLNVTIPYKEAIIPYMDALSENAQKIGAVNTITISENGYVTGHNTDYYGFKQSFTDIQQPHHKKALVLGSGGAAKAILYAFEELGVSYHTVSRSLKDALRYAELTEAILKEYNIIVNCTPLGTTPNIDTKPDLPYQYIHSKHLLYDLVYNPPETAFLALGRQQGALICNGLPMLKLQAEKAWSLWNA